MNHFRAYPEPMTRVSALGYTLGRNPDSMPHNIRPDMSLWNAPDGRELTYIQAQEEALFSRRTWPTTSFLAAMCWPTSTMQTNAARLFSKARKKHCSLSSRRLSVAGQLLGSIASRVQAWTTTSPTQPKASRP